MSKDFFKNKIDYTIVYDYDFWLKKIPKINRIIKIILLEKKFFFNNNYKKYVINFLLTNDNKIKKLNKTYRNISKPTDVLVFSISHKIKKNEKIRICDIAISAQTVRKDAFKLNISFYDHLTHIIIHALLHNNFFKHNNHKNKNKMQSIEILILKNLNISNPYK